MYMDRREGERESHVNLVEEQSEKAVHIGLQFISLEGQHPRW